MGSFSSKTKPTVIAQSNIPPYSIKSIGSRHFLLAGGGGAAKTGVKNQIDLYLLTYNIQLLGGPPDSGDFVLQAKQTGVIDTTTFSNMNMDVIALDAAEQGQYLIAAGQDKYCSLYQVNGFNVNGVSNDEKNDPALSFNFQAACRLETDESSKDPYQQVGTANTGNNYDVLDSDETLLTTSAWKSEILAELVDSLPYTDVGDDFWKQFSKRLDISASRGAFELPESFSFDRQDALIVSMEGCQVGVNVTHLSQHSHFINSIFFGSSVVRYVEERDRTVRLPLIMYRPLLATLLLLESLAQTNSSAASMLCWMSVMSAFSILDVASFLQIEIVLTAVSPVICQKIAASSLLAAHRQSEIRHVPLADLLWEMVIVDFDLLVKGKTYLELEACQLVSLLKEPKLNIKPEEECPLVSEWLQRNKLPGYSEYTKELENALRVSESEISNRLGAGFFDRPRIPTSVLVAVGGWGSVGPMNFLDVYEPNRHCWIPVQPGSVVERQTKSRAYHGVVVNGNHLYLLGGFDGNGYHSSMDRFNFNTMEWSTLSPMHEPRCYLGSALVDSNHIIATGGFNNPFRLKSAEMLDISENQWDLVAPMNVVRSDADCVNVDGTIYVVGGFDGHFCHKTAEFYDPQQNSWFPLSRDMRHSRSGVKAVSIDGVLMVAGGYTGLYRLKEVEFYDPREGLWHPLAKMQLKRSNFGMQTLGGNVIVCGGYSDSSTTSMCESFDWRNDTWTAIPQMISSRSALAVARIERHPIIERIANEYDFGMPFEFL